MHDVDFLPVGDGNQSGDAIIARFTGAGGSTHHLLIDAGLEKDGDAVVERFRAYYGADATIDLAILTHPDGDHLGGMGAVIRQLPVTTLWLQHLAAHGGASLPASGQLDSLLSVADGRGTKVFDVFTGATAFDGLVLVAGPDLAYYEQCVAEQVKEESSGTRKRSTPVLARVGDFVAATLGVETPFGDAGGDGPRNNSSTIIDFNLPEHRFLFTADAGVPALNRALDYLDGQGREGPPGVFQVPHHGSRHNMDTATLNRLYGRPGETTVLRHAQISISAEKAEDPKRPSPRVANGLKRRNVNAYQTAGTSAWFHSADAPTRDGWTTLEPLPALDESLEDDD